MKMWIESREVLAGAYLRKPKAMLSHAVVTSDAGDVAVLCRRVSLDSLADRHASDPHAAPTCAACIRAIKSPIKKRNLPLTSDPFVKAGSEPSGAK